MKVTPILELASVTKSFSAEQAPAVSNLSLSVPPGDILGLLGPSGCGKTTLLRLIAGFERPNAGTIQIGGQVVASGTSWIPPEQRQLGMVFQDYALFPHLTVRENIGFGLQNLGKGEVKNRIDEAIALVSLTGFENRYPHELSGGQQQRVALARALAPRPKLILLDEALSNLDRQVRDRLREEVRHILKTAEISAVFVTHDQQEALSISDLVAVMRHGRLEQWGTPESIYTKPASRFVASFVTQANFLEAKRLNANVWETEIGCFEIAQTQGDTGEVMIRQEDLVLKADPQGKVKICDRQFLGREYRYCLQTDSGKELHALTDKETDLAIGTPVQVYLTRQQPQIFQTSTL
jgi:iron(III) transport system ATP-binding protein